MSKLPMPYPSHPKSLALYVLLKWVVDWFSCLPGSRPCSSLLISQFGCCIDCLPSWGTTDIRVPPVGHMKIKRGVMVTTCH